MEILGLGPGHPESVLAGLSEFGGGVLTALGLLNPLGPVEVSVRVDGHDESPLG
jgi:putative oxidoreductase